MILEGARLAGLNRETARAVLGFRVPAPMRLSDWMDRHFYLSAESSSIQGPWRTLPYQRAMLDAGIANDDVRTVTIAKSARVGYTKMITGAMGFFVAHKRRGFLMYLPTDTDAKGAVRKDIDPALRDVKPLRKALKGDPDKLRSSYNTRSQKIFHGAIADVLGGKAAGNYRSHTKDVVVYDELDAFDNDIQGEGSPLALGDKRLETSSYGKSIRGSTLGISGQSLIEEQLDSADWIFLRELPCPRCDRYAPLKWEQFKYDGDDPASVRRVCDQCGGAAHYADLQAMDARGVWRTEDGIEIDEDGVTFRDASGATVEARPHIAFRIWAAYSYFATWTAMIAEWIAANKHKRQGDTSRLKAFVNLWLGEAWQIPGTVVESDWLATRREQYRAPAPDGVQAIVAGVDVQADRFEIEYLGVGQGEETWSLDFVRILGDTSEAPVYDDLDRALRRRFEMEGAGEMGLAGVGIDSGYNTDLVYSFVRRRPGRGIYALKGFGGFDHPWIKIPKREHINGRRDQNLRVIPVGVDHWKNQILERLQVSQPGPGYCHFPMHYGRDYFDGLTAEKLVPKYKRGRLTHEFIQRRARNEPFDCRVYALVALRLNRGELTNAAAVHRSGTATRANPAPHKQPPQRAPDPFGSGGHQHDGFLDGIGDEWN